MQIYFVESNDFFFMPRIKTLNVYSCFYWGENYENLSHNDIWRLIHMCVVHTKMIPHIFLSC